MSLSFKAVIPARYASTRLPGKPLLDLGGKPMVVRVAERARASGAEEVWIATDHAMVREAAEKHGFPVQMTRSDHPTGTDRLAEVVRARGWTGETIVVNVQGDEPLIAPSLIASVARQLDDSGADIATVGRPLTSARDFFNPNSVKVVCKADGGALYFSRAPIPFARDHFARANQDAPFTIPPALPDAFPAYHHVGLYAYRARFLTTYASLAVSPLESFEALEQLRALWHGFAISVLISNAPHAPGVDTPEDAARIQRQFTQNDPEITPP